MRYLAPLKVLTSLGRGGRFPPLLAFLATLLLLFSFSSSQPSQALPRPHLGYGAFVADLGSTAFLNDIGFGWFVHQLSWSGVEGGSKGQYHWGDLDNILNAAQGSGLKLILRVVDTPGWARSNPSGTAPPDNMNDFGDFMEVLVTRARGKVAGYAIWNEPNLPYEWGGNNPNPAHYVQMLQAVYPRIKAADPEALVITAGMATTGGGGGAACGVGTGIALQKVSPFTQNLYAAGVMPDLDFICGMYLNGGKDYFDVLGSHPYGFAASFDELPSTGLAFRRVEQQRAVMEAMGDSDKQIWAIEFGWVLHPGDSCHNQWDWPDRWWQIVTEAEQATNLVGAYQYAYQNWPWMGVMNFFNLDFATVPWYDYCQTMRWYSVVYRDTPGVGPFKYRPAYYALRDMEKFRAGSIAGHVRDNRDASFVSADVEILGLTSTTTDLSGGYQFTNIVSGTYDLQVSASGYGALEPMRGVVVNEGEALTDVNFYLPPMDDVAQNGGFESDFGGWTIGGDNMPVITDTVHTGDKAAQLGGTISGDSWVEQSVAIPSDIYQPTLSFLYLYPSSDTGDQFQVEIRDAGGNLLDTPWSTASATSLWTHHWLDLSPYEGQTIRVRFLLSENESNPSYLYLDEVSLGKASGGPYKGYLPIIHRGS